MNPNSSVTVIANSMTEAIRRGLPNGAAAAVLTWDLAHLETLGATPNAHVVQWTAIDMTFNDQYPKHMTWVAMATARPFRCMWTNELR